MARLSSLDQVAHLSQRFGSLWLAEHDY